MSAVDKRHEMTLGGATIVVRRRNVVDYDGRRQYSWRITLPNGRTFKARDIWTGASGMGDRGARNMTATLLGYLDAFAEAQDYEHSENRNLFPKGLREWATQNSDEIGMARFEIENPEPEAKPKRRRYSEVIFMQGDEAEQVLTKLAHIEGVVVHGATEESIAEAVEYLSQWDHGEDHRVTDTLGAGTHDDVAEHNGYVLTWNVGLTYVGLSRIIDEE